MSKEFRSFTIRLPTDRYFELCAMAAAENAHLNTKINQLLMLGLGKHISLDQALRKLLLTTVTGESDDSAVAHA